ncbi:MAG: aromatic compound degradation protein PaaI, partial [Propionibacteriaceae bacterium]|nr:aromatic compound degradation protein PaaI [Propionibacteriaceae bacterium]
MNLDSALDAKMGFELLEVSPTAVLIRYPVAGNTQPAKLWHGGASAVAMESAASLAALTRGGPNGNAV